MADDPVIIDDGGSTRIKHHRIPFTPTNGPVGAMDGLLDVTTNIAGIPFSDHTFPAPLGAFTKFKIVFNNPTTGTSTEIPVAGLGGLPALATGDKIEIVSGSFTVQVDIGAGGTSILTIFGPAGSAPQVEAKQHRKRRRYVVSNSPPIDKVTFTPNGHTPPPPAPVFDSSLPANESVYTMIHISGV